MFTNRRPSNRCVPAAEHYEALKRIMAALHGMVCNDLCDMLLNTKSKEQSSEWSAQPFVWRVLRGTFMLMLTCRRAEQPGRRSVTECLWRREQSGWVKRERGGYIRIPT